MTLEQVLGIVKDLGVTGLLLIGLWAILVGRLRLDREVKREEKATLDADARTARADQRHDDLVKAVNRLADLLEGRGKREASS